MVLQRKDVLVQELDAQYDIIMCPAECSPATIGSLVRLLRPRGLLLVRPTLNTLAQSTNRFYSQAGHKSRLLRVRKNELSSNSPVHTVSVSTVHANIQYDPIGSCNFKSSVPNIYAVYQSW